MINYENFKKDKDIDFLVRGQAISIVTVSDWDRKCGFKVNATIKGNQYINQQSITTLPGLIDLVIMRKIEAFKRQLIDFDLSKGQKGLSSEEENKILYFLKSDLFTAGYAPNDPPTESDILNYLEDYENGKNYDRKEEVHALIESLQTKIVKVNYWAKIGGNQGLA